MVKSTRNGNGKFFQVTGHKAQGRNRLRVMVLLLDGEELVMDFRTKSMLLSKTLTFYDLRQFKADLDELFVEVDEVRFVGHEALVDGGSHLEVPTAQLKRLTVTKTTRTTRETTQQGQQPANNNDMANPDLFSSRTNLYDEIDELESMKQRQQQLQRQQQHQPTDNNNNNQNQKGSRTRVIISRDDTRLSWMRANLDDAARLAGEENNEEDQGENVNNTSNEELDESRNLISCDSGS